MKNSGLGRFIGVQVVYKAFPSAIVFKPGDDADACTELPVRVERKCDIILRREYGFSTGDSACIFHAMIRNNGVNTSNARGHSQHPFYPSQPSVILALNHTF